MTPDLAALVDNIKDNIRSGEVGPNILCRQVDKLAAALESLAAENARLSETWTDDSGQTWTPPTAWAYAQICVAHQSLRTQLISANAKIKRAEAERDALAKDAELGQCLLHYIDRINDRCEQDPWERSVNDLLNAADILICQHHDAANPAAPR